MGLLDNIGGGNGLLPFGDRFGDWQAVNQMYGRTLNPGIQAWAPMPPETAMAQAPGGAQGAPGSGILPGGPQASPAQMPLWMQTGAMGTPPGAQSASAQPPGMFDRIMGGISNGVAAHPQTLMAMAGGFGQPGWGFGNAMRAAGPAMQADRQAQLQTESQQAAYQAVRAAGGTHAQAMAAMSNPEVFKALAPDLFGAPKVVQTGEGPFGKSFLLQQGSKFSPIPGQDGGVGGGGSVGMNVLAAGVKQYDPSLPADEYLNQFGPEVQAAVKAYLRGDVMPSGNPRQQGLSTTAKTIAQTYGMKAGIDASDIAYAAKRKMQVDLAASGNSSIGGIISNGKSAFEHLGNLSDKLVGVGNYSGPDVPGGAYLGDIANISGNRIFQRGSTRAAITGANDNALKYGQEATKFYAGSGGGEAERMAALKALDPKSSSSMEMASFLQTEKELMLGRLRQKEAQIRDTLGPEYLDKHPVMTRDLQDTLDKLDGNIAKLRGQESAKPSVAPPAPAITALKANPKLSDQFDAKYGPGAAARALGMH